nr:hypothetical protein [Kibdelosporangium sp. MJ126-NF4]
MSLLAMSAGLVASCSRPWKRGERHMPDDSCDLTGQPPSAAASTVVLPG